MLLGDGSPTRHLQLLTNQETKIKLISKLKDGKEFQKMGILHQEINQTNKVNQNQEIFLDQEEEEYSFVNSLIPE